LGVVEVTTTPFPSPTLNVPSKATKGRAFTVNIGGTEYYPSSEYSTNPYIEYELYVGANLLKRGNKSSKTFSDSVSYTPTQDGTITFKLVEAED
jgi:hypothetical protein